jgi:D-tyrosyl-tRNA(Tyr) deacylase
MRVLLQRVNHASVVVGTETVGEINRGLLIYAGLQASDTQAVTKRMCERILNYRVFPDDQGRMNLSLMDVGGGILLVSQFTLAAETHRGNRPGFSTAMAAEEAQSIFEGFVAAVRDRVQMLPISVATGQFQADMQVKSINDGPINFLLEVPA